MPMDILNLYNLICTSLLRMTRMTDGRLKSTNALTELFSVKEIEEGFRKAQSFETVRDSQRLSETVRDNQGQSEIVSPRAEENRTEENRTEEKREEFTLSSETDEDRELKPMAILNLYNSICTSLPRATKKADSRHKSLNALKVLFSAEEIEEGFKKAQSSETV